MKKSKIVKILLILSILIFLALVGFYFYQKQANKPVTVSQRELYQSQFDQSQEE